MAKLQFLMLFLWLFHGFPIISPSFPRLLQPPTGPMAPWLAAAGLGDEVIPNGLKQVLLFVPGTERITQESWVYWDYDGGLLLIL